jgi:hypothetical protein
MVYLYLLIQHLTDQNDLEEIVEKLRDARKSLIQYIRLASVGLAKNDGIITVDTRVVKSTDEAVQKILGKELGLDIAPDGKYM